ncbi:hypothetical protein T492DRAFT_843410 [Pavlovales sp. CCMP2436]|nr:hypothetical protein T492DRAFT_843410 [Pavlovales sp. CCMP2436]
MTAVDALNQGRLLSFMDTDPRNRVTHWLLNGQPYDGAMHPRFDVGQKWRSIYMTGVRHHALSEKLEYSSRPVIIDRSPLAELPREDRDPKTNFNSFKGGVYDDTLPDPRGDPVLNRTIIPEHLRPFDVTRTQFTRPRGAVAGGGRGAAVLFERIAPQGDNQQTQNASVPDSSAEVSPFYRSQPPYIPTQAPATQTVSNPMLAMVPRQVVRRDTRRFQVNPSLGIGPFMPPPLMTRGVFSGSALPLMTRGVFSGSALPPGFVRAPQLASEESQSSQLTSQAALLVIYTPPTPGAATSSNFQSSSSSGGRSSLLGLARAESLSLNTTTIEVPYVASTSTETLLSFSDFKPEQNQTRDTKKTLEIKTPPPSSEPVDLTIPFDQGLYGSPLSVVADLKLLHSLTTTDNKSLGVQFSFLEDTPIGAGYICVLGDTLSLEAENMADPKLSTYTFDQLLPEDPTSIDTPSQIVTKWHATMRPVVGVTNFGHCSIGFDEPSGKFVAIHIVTTKYGPIVNVFNQVNRDYGDDLSKNALGLLLTAAPNTVYHSDMPPTKFPNVASAAYVRGGVVIDRRKRIELELLATGSQGTAQRKLKYDITHYMDEQNPILMPYDPSRIFTLLLNSENTINFYAGITQVSKALENPNVTQAYYTQIYRPVIRVCGGTIIDGAYSDEVVNIDSPVFTNTNTIVTSSDWSSASGFSVVASSAYQSNASFAADKALDRTTSTYWASGENTYNASGMARSF